MKEQLFLPHSLNGLIWYYKSSSPLLHSAHTHNELEANLIIRGRGTYIVCGERVRMEPGVLLWLFPDQDHLLAEHSSDFEMWIMVWKGSGLCGLEQDPAYSALRRSTAECVESRQLPLAVSDRFHAEVRDLDHHRDDPTVYNAGLRYLLLRLWKSFRHTDIRPVSGVLHSAVERAARLLSASSDHDDLDRLARACGLSRSRLSHLFSEEMGQTLIDFRNRRRLDRYLRIIRASSCSSMEAALEAGFGSYPQFHRVARQHLGVSPRELSRVSAKRGRLAGELVHR